VGFNQLRSGHGDTLISSVNITRDTPAVVASSPPSSNILNIEAAGKSNVLSSYRSYTYNFTLSAVSIKKANDPENYRKSSQDFVILKSGGKGSAGLTGDVTGSPLYRTETSTSAGVSDGDGFKVNIVSKKVITGYDRESAKSLVNDFNKKSPGRFDMYIDNVEIGTIMAPSKAGGLTLPTNISFDVFEPYSINGFIEALQVSAQAAGYDVYSNASFLLKVDFIGYSDKEDLPSPEPIPNTSRYFLIRFTGMSIEVTEKGTKYACTAVPFADKGFGEEGKLQVSTSMSGVKVGETLKSFMTDLNNKIKNPNNATNSDDTESDTYEIKFPEWNAGAGWDLKDSKENSIANADMSYNKKGGDLVRLVRHDAASTTTSLAEALGTSAAQPTIQFKEGDNIHDIITATIRDSAYVREKLEKIHVDDYGRINYFLIRLHVENKDKINSPKGRPYQIFTYIVTEHKVHYTFIPTYATSQAIDKSKLKTQVLRDYNYLYTGKNVDITAFKLDYNYLYFEAIPRALGRNNDTGLANATNKDNAIERNGVKPIDSKIGRAETQADSDQAGVHSPGLINSGQPNSDPYTAMARNMHLALVNSVSRVTGDLEIIGDPFYLVTGGIGNYNPKPSETQQGVTADNEADRFYGQVLISLTFSNPVDIDETTGSLKFEPSSADASGVFMVTEAASSFKEGVFKQRLKLVRVPGQLPDNIKPTKPEDTNVNVQDADKISAEVAITKGA
jgi:hypothetical protein